MLDWLKRHDWLLPFLYDPIVIAIGLVIIAAKAIAAGVCQLPL